MTTHESAALPLDVIVGRKIFAENGQSVGRLEECRGEQRGTKLVITEYVIGVAGLLERLGLGVRLVLGRHKGRGFLARWDQLDISDPDCLRLTCAIGELRRL